MDGPNINVSDEQEIGHHDDNEKFGDSVGSGSEQDENPVEYQGDDNDIAELVPGQSKDEGIDIQQDRNFPVRQDRQS